MSPKILLKAGNWDDYMPHVLASNNVSKASTYLPDKGIHQQLTKAVMYWLQH